MKLAVIALFAIVVPVQAFLPLLPKKSKAPWVVDFKDDRALLDPPTFSEFIGASGFSVVTHDKVPRDFTVQPLSVDIPASWYPTVFYSKSASDSMNDEFWATSKAFGLLDVPGAVKAFEQLDIAEFGGSQALLQPGRNREGAFLVHEFTYVFAMWDDVIENDQELGLASIARTKKLAEICLKSTAYDRDPVLAILKQATEDAPFLRYWVHHFHHVRATLSESALERYTDAFLRWCDSLVDEIHSLHALNANEIDIEEQWRIRIESVAGFVFCPLLSTAACFEPSEDFWKQPAVERMHYLYTAILREVNELVSIPKDIVDECGSLFTSTMLVQRTSVEETIDHFLGRLSNSIKEFDRIEDMLRASGIYEDGAQEYFQTLRESAVGICEWHLSSKENKRYNKVVLCRPQEALAYNFSLPLMEEVPMAEA